MSDTPSSSSPSGPIPRWLYPLILFLACIWSLNFVVMKVAMREIPGPTLAAMRFTLAGICVAPVYLWKRGHELRDLPKRPGFKSLAFAGPVGVGLNQLSFMLGVERTSVANAAIVISMVPLLVLLAVNWLGHETITRAKLIGLAIAVSGVATLQFRHFHESHKSSPVGDLFIVVAAITWAWFTVTSKSVRAHFDGLTMNMFCYVGSAIVFLPLSIWLISRFPVHKVSAMTWVALVYMSLVPSVLGMVIYYRMMRYLAASRASMVSYLQPVFASLFAVLLIGEPITASIVMGGMLVLTGVFVAERDAWRAF